MNSQPDTNGRAPAMLLFHADLKRFWSRENRRAATLVLGAVLVLQFAVGCALLWSRPTLGAQNWAMLAYVASMLGLHGSWSTALLQGFGVAPAFAAASPRAMSTWAAVATGILGTALQILLPAFAALSIAPDRENGRTEELLLAGFRPSQILFAKGAATLLPLGAVWLIGRLVTDLALLLTTGSANPIMPPFAALPWPALTLLAIAGVLTRAGILVCVSALSQRFGAALVGCYAAAFVLLPLLSLTLMAPLQALGLPPSKWWLPFYTVPLALQALIFAVLLPRALAALGRAESDGRSNPPREATAAAHG